MPVRPKIHRCEYPGRKVLAGVIEWLRAQQEKQKKKILISQGQNPIWYRSIN